MVTYNPKDWFRLITHFHKSDTFRILLPAIIFLGLITGVVTYIEKNYFLGDIPTNLTVFHQISGFIISLVLVFRINSAYDRWWEGRKLWGSLLNNSRNIALKMNAIISENDKDLRMVIQNLLRSYAFELKEHLRGNNAMDHIKFDSILLKDKYQEAAHKPNYIASVLTSRVISYIKSKDQSSNDYLIINENIDDLTEICGACERIKNTPIPYSYSIFIKKIIFFYIITMPLTFGVSMGYWSIPLVMIMFYAFTSLELLSEEIEDPFGTDFNDLPTDEIAGKIDANTKEILST